MSLKPPPLQPHARRLLIWLVVAILAAVLLVARSGQPSARGIKAAAAKGGVVGAQMLALTDRDRALLNLASADPLMRALLAGKETAFLSAHPLGHGVAAAFDGCLTDCLLLTFYNFSEGGTLNAVFNPDGARFTATWANPAARPNPTGYLVERIVAIAAADPGVQAVLGNAGGVRKAASAMLPMSTWLVDDACRDDWCVDLTFHDPAGTGRIFHVVVNLHQERVARTFYTRGRAVRSQPAAQWQETGRLFTDGCREQDGWSVCWEMTPHDGVNYYNARYNGALVFNTAKIGQVEAYYPSWPGGYRDEIGYAATVPPKFDTRIVQLDDGFEVRQLFTEPFDWPNCICCYRYEQGVRFFVDGSFEPLFVSYGPGCDELSEYRPFWRINMALDGPEGDEVWVWNGARWEFATTEQDLDLFTPLSPEGARLATLDGAVGYLWQPTPTDPLRLDTGRLFAVQNEGDGPIETGPADTYEPPRRYVDGERLDAAESDLVIWYTPVLKTKRGGPWWCMPDPEPEISPCEAGLRVARITPPLRQPTAEELAQLQATPTPLPTDAAPADATPTRRPTPRPVGGQTADEIILNAGCGACHRIGPYGEGGKVGPDLSNIGAVAGERVPGQPAAEYLYNSIIYPNLFIAPDCPNGPCLADIMPGIYFLTLTDQQVATLVDYLLGLRGEGTGAVGSSAEPTRPPVTPPGATPTGDSRPVTIGWEVLAVAAAGAVLLLTAVIVLLWQQRKRSGGAGQ